MEVFDTSILALFLEPGCFTPRHPETGEPVSQAQERILHLIAEIEKRGKTILIPAPTLSEVLIGADDAAREWLSDMESSETFEIVSFDQAAAWEAAKMVRESILRTGDKRGGQPGSWAKVKFDHQIVAISKTLEVDAIHSEDTNIHRLGELVGIDVFRIADLPLPTVET